MNGNGNGRGLIINYRQVLTALTNGQTFFTFRIPSHPQAALVIERLVLKESGAGNTIVPGDLARVRLSLAPSESAFNNNLSTIVLADTSYVVFGGGTGVILGINPPGAPGIVYSPPVRLAPSDDPAFIAVQTNPHRFADDMVVIVQGWEVPTLDIATFPQPTDVSAVI